MMNRLRILMLAGLIACGAWACDDGPTDPGSLGGGSVDLGVDADLELQVVGDEMLADVVAEDMALSMGSSGDGPGPFSDSRQCFRDARQLLRNGDEEGARAKAVECRRVLVAAMIGRGGEAAIDELFGRVERLLERIGEADDEFERLSDLEARLRELVDEAHALRDGGDLVGAGERLVLALQITDRMRHRHRDFVRNPEGHARLSVAMGGEAVRLAEGVIEEPTQTQEVLLFRAGELQRRAVFAFSQGWYRRAVVQAHRAEGVALHAVLNGERPTVEDALRLLSLAEEGIVTAGEAVGDDPTDLQLALLNRATRLKNKGEQAINTWHWRGVGLLWHSSVMSAVLIPDPGFTDIS
jgi:HEPN domain-containing protein